MHYRSLQEIIPTCYTPPPPRYLHYFYFQYLVYIERENIWILCVVQLWSIYLDTFPPILYFN